MLSIRLSRLTIAPVILTLGTALPPASGADTGTVQFDQGAPRVVVSGSVPDEATKRKVLADLRGIYGERLVVDRVMVGGVQAPPDWTANVSALITPQLKSISRGMLAIEGTAVSVRGEVSDETVRQGIGSDMQEKLQSGYTLSNGLRVSASGQAMLDRTLDGRVIEFENGSAMLTASGMRILDEMADVMKRMSAVKFEVIGHTDSIGTPASNLALSRARAESVKTYLVRKGIGMDMVGTSGMGADHPVASNALEEGRKKNRRIEFRAAR